MSKINASAVYPIGQMLRELAAGTPFVVVTADGRKHTGPADFRVIEGVATLAFEEGILVIEPASPAPLAALVTDDPAAKAEAFRLMGIPAASDGTPE